MMDKKSKYLKIKCKKCNDRILRKEGLCLFKTKRVCKSCSEGLKWQEKIKARALKRIRT